VEQSPAAQKPYMNKHRDASAGFVLVEMLMVVGLIGLMTGIAMLSFGSMWGNLRFKRQAEDLVNVFQMAYNGSVETSRRYAVILDFAGQGFVLREYQSLDLTVMDPEEAILQTGFFSKDLTIDYVVYDDLDDTRDWENVSEARFLAGHAGWQYGGLVVLLDDDGMPWTLVIHRFARPVELLKGEWDLDSLGMLPQDKENVRF